MYGLLADLIRSIGWSVVTDNNMFVTAVGLEVGEKLSCIEISSN